jgi:DNA-binding IclR family transcriptional regulator
MLKSAATTLRALEHLVEIGEVGVSDVGRHVGVTVGTAHRLVATLVETGFAEQNPSTRKYRPSAKLLRLAQRMRARLNVGDVTHGYLVELGRQVHETVNLGVLRDGEVLYVDKVTSDQPFGIEARVGSRLPAYCTALGKVLMAYQDEPAIEGYLERLDDGDAGDHRPTPDAGAFRRELDRVRRRGLAEDRGEYLPEVFCVAAPVFSADDRVVAAISITTPRSRFDAGHDELTPLVQATSKAISDVLRELGVTELAQHVGH